jgi:hypothetical protein
MVRAFGLVADRDESDVALQQRHSDGERKRGQTISALDFAARPDSYSSTRRLVRSRPTPQRQLPAPLWNFDGGAERRVRCAFQPREIAGHDAEWGVSRRNFPWQLRYPRLGASQMRARRGAEFP